MLYTAKFLLIFSLFIFIWLVSSDLQLIWCSYESYRVIIEIIFILSYVMLLQWFLLIFLYWQLKAAAIFLNIWKQRSLLQCVLHIEFRLKVTFSNVRLILGATTCLSCPSGTYSNSFGIYSFVHYAEFMSTGSQCLSHFDLLKPIALSVSKTFLFCFAIRVHLRTEWWHSCAAHLIVYIYIYHVTDICILLVTAS